MLEEFVRPLETPTPFSSRRIATSVPTDTTTPTEPTTITWGSAGSVPEGIPQPEGAGNSVNFQVACCAEDFTQWHVPEYQDVKVHPRDDPETYVIERRPRRIVLQQAENWCNTHETKTRITFEQVKGYFNPDGSPLISGKVTKGSDDCKKSYGYAFDYGDPIEDQQTQVIRTVRQPVPGGPTTTTSG